MALLAVFAFGFVFYLSTRPSGDRSSTGEPETAKPLPPLDLEPLEWSTRKRDGAYVELRIAAPGDAPDKGDLDRGQAGAHYLSDTVVTLLGAALSEAHAGYSEYRPNLFTPGELRTLVTSLRAWKDEWMAFATLADVHARWDRVSPYIANVRTPSDWQRVRDKFSKTLDALAAFFRASADRNESLWLLGYGR